MRPVLSNLESLRDACSHPIIPRWWMHFAMHAGGGAARKNENRSGQRPNPKRHGERVIPICDAALLVLPPLALDALPLPQGSRKSQR